MASFKRMRQSKMNTQSLLDFDLGESSSDSDFRIEDHDTEGEDQDSNDEENSSENSTEDEDDTDNEDGSEDNASDDSTQQLKQLLIGEGGELQMNGLDDLTKILKQLDYQRDVEQKVSTKPICCVCLGDRSDDSNEIIECDGCGVSVHEGCYGVSDNVSISSTNSTCSTEPWFCEACRAGVSEPICELCPNKGGIYKETDVGKWVHLICALYIPGVAFGEVDQLTSVTLFEMPYSKWGAKVCSLCENSRFARTGVCIGCDAGMCKTYFHVTCAQIAGFLTEAHHEDTEAADPFFAHCKVHSEKEMIKRRKRNFHSLRVNMQTKQREKVLLKLDDPCPAQLRIQRKLLKYQQRYSNGKKLKADPWVPTQKMSRLLTTSASACKRLLAKANIMAVDVELLERQEAQIAALTDIRKKWHIAPAFSVEFIGYYLDRISRSKELKQQLSEMMDNNVSLSQEQDSLRVSYDARLEKNKELKSKQETLVSVITQLHKEINAMCPNKIFPHPSNIGYSYFEAISTKAASTPPSRPISVPTAAALKMGVGFPLAHLGPPGTKVDSSRLLSTHAKSSPIFSGGAASAPTTPTLNVQTFECGICKRNNDQHLLAKCDTCQLHYHLGCLNPPLTRHPKKSKLYGWQCSECDKSEDSDGMAEIPKGPRKSRTRFNKDGSIIAVSISETEIDHGPPAKRRSVDAVIPKGQPAKKKLNKSLPTTNENETPAKFASKMALLSTPILNRKSKCYVPVQNIKEKPQSPVSSEPQNLKKGTTHHANLSTDEPLLLVMTSAPIPRAMDPIHTPDPDPLALPVNSNTTVSSLEDSSDPNKQTRKQKRKEKHKSKHNLSSDTEKSPNKEHKRKHKKKLHGHDTKNPNESGSVNIPKIKIKFKTLPLPGEVTPEAQFFYVSADMVRSAEEASRPTSVETVEDLTPILAEERNVESSKSGTVIDSPGVVTTKPPLVTRKTSPRKSAGKRNLQLGHSKSTTTTQSSSSFICCVCQEAGSNGNAVTCDECHKHYHFTCLDPPLKKTPKIRGYSWHCADCDPTDDEK